MKIKKPFAKGFEVIKTIESSKQRDFFAPVNPSPPVCMYIYECGAKKIKGTRRGKKVKKKKTEIKKRLKINNNNKVITESNSAGERQ